MENIKLHSCLQALPLHHICQSSVGRIFEVWRPNSNTSLFSSLFGKTTSGSMRHSVLTYICPSSPSLFQSEYFHLEGMSSFSDHKTIPHSFQPSCVTHRLTGAGKHPPSAPNLFKRNGCGSVWVYMCVWISFLGCRHPDRFPAARADMGLQVEAGRGSTGVSVDRYTKYLNAVADSWLTDSITSWLSCSWICRCWFLCQLLHTQLQGLSVIEHWTPPAEALSSIPSKDSEIFLRWCKIQRTDFVLCVCMCIYCL